DAQRLLWRAAELLLPARGAGRFNQALMELGSQICRPRDPACPKCPVANLCPTHRGGLHELIPQRRRKPQIEQVREAAVIIRRRARSRVSPRREVRVSERLGDVLLVRRAEGERWAGYWDFARFTCNRSDRRPTAEELKRKVLTLFGIAIKAPRHRSTLRHTVTRFRITLECFDADGVATRRAHPPRELTWVRPADLREYPLSATGRRIARILDG
ncbi:MAG TPA: NUDIX domain-containing protein, partial [Pirellulales bacterium]|nr:NUDIX domain-containing protein [Pirellulales bacterium]